MAYRIAVEEGVEAELQRIAREQIDKAREEAQSTADLPAAVHDVRKRCKKMRGLLRLVRASLGNTYSVENAWYRDIARDLGASRDAHTSIQTFDRLVRASGFPGSPESLSALRSGLEHHMSSQQATAPDIEVQLQLADQRLAQGRERVAQWRLSVGKRAKHDDLATHFGWDAIRPSFCKTFRRGRRALAAARKHGTSEDFHELRKLTKYHGYQLRLLRELWRKPLRARAKEVERLAQTLGDLHDLVVLLEWLDKLESGRDKDRSPDLVTMNLVRDSAIEPRQRLQSASLELAGLIFADKPRAWTDCLGRYWKVSSRSHTTR